MTISPWEAGKLYSPGATVRPTYTPGSQTQQVVNGTFESGDTGWVKGTGWTINNGDMPYQGTWSAKFNHTGTSNLDGQDAVPVTPGQSIQAQAAVQQGASSAGEAGARVSLVWFDAADAEISVSEGSMVDSASGGAWRTSTLTASAPSNAASMKVRVTAFRTGGSDPLWVDNISWNYAAPTEGSNLVFVAVQDSPATSAAIEPSWPMTNGIQVIDGGVIWEAVTDARIVYRAEPILESGATEPDWPVVANGVVADNTIQWRAITRRVEDENCPNKIPTRIIASHVFNGDDDIVNYCAVANPLDWTSEGDAGFLPTGLQQSNSNGVSVLAMYRANLAVLNASSFQLWQADPDPDAMDILDQKDGIGSIYPRAAINVGDDLFYLTAEGIRSIVGSAGNNSLSYDAVGAPIDDLVRTALDSAIASGVEPIGSYYPGLGQVLLAFPTMEPGGEYVALDVSGIDYTLMAESEGVFESASAIQYQSDPPSDLGCEWVLTFPPGTLVRVTVDDFTFPEGMGSTAEFITENQTVSNTSETPDTQFLPQKFEIVTGDDGVLYFALPGASTGLFSFYIEVFMEDEGAEDGETEVFVGTKVKGSGWTWSRWLFPFLITDFSLFGTDMYFRHGDCISHFDTTVAFDEIPDPENPTSTEYLESAFAGWVQWNWLDCGEPGSTKHMQSFDLVATGVSSVSFGYDQRDKTVFTDPYTIGPDTLVGGPVQYEITAPTISPRVDFAAGEQWSLSSMVLYVDNLGPGL